MTQPLPNDEQLSAYLDNELSSEECALVQQRLATDSDYAATLASYRDQRESLRSLPRNAIDVRGQVMAAVADDSLIPRRRPAWKVPTALYAIGALAAMLLVALFVVVPQWSDDPSIAQVDTAVVKKTAPVAAAEVPVVESDLQVLESTLHESTLSDQLSEGSEGTYFAPDKNVSEKVVARAAEVQPVSPAMSRRASGKTRDMSSALPASQPDAAALSGSSGFFAHPGAHDGSAEYGVGQEADADLLADAKPQPGAQLFAQKTILVRPVTTNRGGALTVDQFKQLAKKVGLVAKPEVASLNMTQQAYLGREKQSAPTKLSLQSSTFLITATDQQISRLKEALMLTSKVTEIDSSSNLDRARSGAANQAIAGAMVDEERADVATDRRSYRVILDLGGEPAPAVDAK